MALRKWSGPICEEGVQTGDGRFIVPGGLEWADLPLPLGAIKASMHNMPIEYEQVGIIETIESGGMATGVFDDEIPAAAELIRRMEAGTAPHGNAVFVSIDPDNWECEIILKDMDDDGGPEEPDMMVMSGRTPTGARSTWVSASPLRQSLVAAAGDGDPAEDGQVLWTETVDEIVERYLRLRIRGATVCDVPAFAGAFITLDGAAAEETPEEETPPEEEPAEEAAAVVASGEPFRPPAEWFTDPVFGEAGEDPRLHQNPVTGSWACPLTITPDGRIFGHVAPFHECHIGVQGTCVMAPHSLTDYAFFQMGSLPVEGCDCEALPVGLITMNTDHLNDLEADWQSASRHYADTGTQAAYVVAGEDDYGVWIAGAVNPDLSESDRRALGAASLSGDWRPIGAGSELVAILAVNVPGFGIPRTRVVVASGEMRLVLAGGRFMVPQPDPVADELRRVRDDNRVLRAQFDRLSHNLAPLEREAILASVGPRSKPKPERVTTVARN